MRGHANAAGLDDAVIVNTCAVTGEAVRQARQTIRKIRRENPDKTDHRHRLRRADRKPTPSPPCRKSIACSAISRSSMRVRGRTARASAKSVDRHHGGASNVDDADRRHRRPRARDRAGAEWLRSSLHLLRHPVRARQFALGADGRCRRAGAQARRQRLSRDRADRRRHHELWRDTCRMRRSSARW